jgi:transposase
MKYDNGSYTSIAEEFTNNKHGFNQLVKWVRKHATKDFPICYVMEPTGVYYEALALHLNRLNFMVHVVPGQRVKNFAMSEGIRTKTDMVDATVIARLGCNKRDLREWHAPNSTILNIRSMCRFRNMLIKQLSMLSNCFEALTESPLTTENLRNQCSSARSSIERSIKNLEAEIQAEVNKDEKFKSMVQLASSIPSVGELTATVILAETDCFSEFYNQRQLISFAGMDVVARQSGSCDPRRHISKKGSVAIRAILYNNAMSAVHNNPRITEFFKRVKASNPAGKVAMVAVMRKLLIWIYAICKSGIPYDPEYK